MTTLRWLLTVPLWIIGLASWFIATLVLQGLSLRFCPPAQIISGACAASWYPVVDQVALCMGAAAGAVAMVALPALVAPSARRHVAWIAFSTGTLLALALSVASGDSAIAPLVSAMAAGLIAVILIGRSHPAA